MKRSRVVYGVGLLVVLAIIPVAVFLYSRFGAEAEAPVTAEATIYSEPVALEVGQEAQVILTGTLALNERLDEAPIGYVLEGDGWRIYADFSAYPSSETEQFLGAKIRVAGTEQKLAFSRSSTKNNEIFPTPVKYVDYVVVESYTSVDE